MRLIHGIKCPDCGTLIDVEFTVDDHSYRKDAANMISMRAVQSAPMVCECGFRYDHTRKTQIEESTE